MTKEKSSASCLASASFSRSVALPSVLSAERSAGADSSIRLEKSYHSFICVTHGRTPFHAACSVSGLGRAIDCRMSSEQPLYFSIETRSGGVVSRSAWMLTNVGSSGFGSTAGGEACRARRCVRWRARGGEAVRRARREQVAGEKARKRSCRGSGAVRRPLARRRRHRRRQTRPSSSLLPAAHPPRAARGGSRGKAREKAKRRCEAAHRRLGDLSLSPSPLPLAPSPSPIRIPSRSMKASFRSLSRLSNAPIGKQRWGGKWAAAQAFPPRRGSSSQSLRKVLFRTSGQEKRPGCRRGRRVTSRRRGRG